MKDTRAIIDCQNQMATIRVGNEEARIGLYEGTHPPPDVLLTAPPVTCDSPGPLTISPDLPEQNRNDLRALLDKYSTAWSSPELGKCTAIMHRIDTGSEPPIAVKPRKLAADKRQEVKRQIDELLAAGAIEKAKGPWAAPVVLVQKKGESGGCVSITGN